MIGNIDPAWAFYGGRAYGSGLMTPAPVLSVNRRPIGGLELTLTLLLWVCGGVPRLGFRDRNNSTYLARFNNGKGDLRIRSTL